MNSTDILHIILGVGYIIMVVCIIYTTYYFVKTLKSFQNFIDHADNFSEVIKNGLKLKALTTLPALLLALVDKVIKKRDCKFG